ncbi:MAG: AMP-binding protein [Rhodospirillales bacterium]|nr:AMP-binding protein [Rhodospirillales bacterium]
MVEQNDAGRLFGTIRLMMEEMGRSSEADYELSLDLTLDRDLGFDSLSKMELVHRIESEFGVALADEVIHLSDTPRDLLRAISAGTGAKSYEVAVLPMTRKSGAAAPAEANTLNRVLAWHADANGDRLHVRLLGAKGEVSEITYSELWQGAGKIAAGLIQRGIGPGDSVILMLPTGFDYFRTFFGILRAGGVPVPVYPPGRPQQLEEHIRRHAKIAENAKARFLIAPEEAKEFSGLLQSLVIGLKHVVSPNDLAAAETPSAFPDPEPTDRAFIQYTSGSTGDPKGVILSHANLLANIRAMGARLNVGADDVFVSWLPLYHDMGLIGAWLGSLTHAIPLVLMSPLTFLARPERWLRAISDHKGTLSGAPNFAYELCLSRLGAKELKGLDLSSWRIAFSGAEPVNWRTLENFIDRFSDFKFARSSLMPVYGLAENSVGLAFPIPGSGPKYDRIDRLVLSKYGRAEPSNTEDDNLLTLPSCGMPLAGHQVRIVDETARELPDRIEGRLQFMGPSATTGYLHNAEATAELFDGDWLNTGDLGYVVDGEIYITGRVKDLIIRGGRNIYPAELETAIGNLEGLRSGAVAVFGSPDPDTGTERLVVMAETRRRGGADQSQIIQAVNSLAADIIGSPPDLVLLVPPRSVPKTSSGKIRRNAARQIFEQNKVSEKPANIRWQIFKIAIAGIRPNLRRSAGRINFWIYGAYLGALALVVVPFLWIAVAILPNQAWRWNLLRAAIKVLLPAAGIKLSVEDAERFPAKRPLITVSNHSSYLDGLLLVAVFSEQLSFVVKAELRDHFISRIFLERLGCLFVERFEPERRIEDAKTITRMAAAGRAIHFFPEGTLARMAGLLPFQSGAFTVAAETGAAVLPVVIRGSRNVLRDGTFIPRPGHITVKIMEPLQGNPKPDSEGDNIWRRATELRTRVRQLILDHCGEPDLKDENALLDLANRQTLGNELINGGEL